MGSLLGFAVVLAGVSVVAPPAAQAVGDDWGGLGFKIAPHTVTPTERIQHIPVTYGPFIAHSCTYSVLVSIAKKDAVYESSLGTYGDRTHYYGIFETRSAPGRNSGIYLRQNSSEIINQGPYFSYNTGQIDEFGTDYGDRVVGIAWRDYEGYTIHKDASAAFADAERAEFEKECAAIRVKWQAEQLKWAAGSTQFLRSPRFDTTCTVKQTGPGGSDLVFDSRSEVEDGIGYTQDWTFSDGTTSKAGGAVRAATKPGPFTGVFTIAGGGRTSVATCKADVKAPALGVGVSIVDDDGVPIAVDAPPSVGDTIHVRVRVSAGADGVGALSGLRPVTEWLTANGPVERVGEPVLPDGPFELKPDERRDVMFDYRVTQAGPIGFGSAVQGTDAIGRLVQADGGTRDTVAGIGVEVTTSWPTPPPKEGVVPPPAEFQADNNGDGKVTDADHVLTVTVKTTNLLDVPLKDVHAKDPKEAVDFVNDLPGGAAAAIEPLAGATYDTKYGDLAAGASATKTYRYQATEEVDADANVSLRGTTADDRVVPGFGTADAKLGSHLALQVRMDMEDRPTTSGQVVRLRGSLTNLLKDKTLPDGTVQPAPDIVVMLFPITEDNAGNGFVSTSTGGRTPLDSDPIVVPPGATIDINPILVTERSEISSHAKVHYLVKAWQGRDDATRLAPRIDATRVQFDEDETSSAAHDMILAPDPLSPDEARECETTHLDAIVSCNLWRGLRDLGYAAVDVTKLTVRGGGIGLSAYARLLRYDAYVIKQTVLTLAGDPAAQEALNTEARVDAETFVQLGLMAPEAIDGAGNAFTSALNEAQDVVANGDSETILAYMSYQLGSSPDLGIAAITRLRMFRAIHVAAIADTESALSYAAKVERIRQANAVAAAAKQDGLLQRVRASVARGETVAESGVFKGAEDITDIPEIYSGVGGARQVDVQNALQIAKDTDSLIVYRGRAPISQRLLDTAKAYLKPMDVKTKCVNEIDKHYLGYRPESLGRVELTEPPIDFGLTKPGLEAEFEAALDAHMDKLAHRFPEIANDAEWAAEVRSRLELRTREYPKELANFSRYVDDGIKIEFGYGEQGLDRSLDHGATEIRKAAVTPGVTTDAFGVQRRYFELQMAGPGNGQLRYITGDIDIVAILNPDRTPITDVAKRLRIYGALQELLGMQHGETFTWTNVKKQLELLRDHAVKPDGSTKGVDVLYVAGNDGRLRTGFFEERLSSASTEATENGASTYQLVTGAPTELITNPARSVPSTIASYDATWAALQKASLLLTPGKIDQFVDGMTHDQVDTFFNRQAAPLRAGPDGSVQSYSAGGGPSTRPQLRGTAARPSAAATTRSETNQSSTVPEIAAVLDRATTLGIDLAQPAEITGPGAAGGTWRQIPLDQALAQGRAGTLDMAPVTSISRNTPAGATTAPITTLDQLAMNPASPFFAAGDTVVLDPGGSTEEKAVLTGVAPFRFASPLRSAHAAGTTVVLVATPAATGPTTTGPTIGSTIGSSTTIAGQAVSSITARARRTARGRVVVTVSVASLRTPAGEVRLMVGRKRVATGVLRGDSVVLRSRKVPPGRKVLRIRYVGSPEVAPSTRTVRVRVPRSTPR